MNTPLVGRTLSAAAGLLLACGIFSGIAQGQAAFNLNPGGFTAANVCANSASPAASCRVLTNGVPNLPTVISGGILRLNSATPDQHASAWYVTKQPLNTGFTTAFQFTISGSPGDGMAFVIQGDALGTGALGYDQNGHNIAYGNENVSAALGFGQAITNSLAVELDTYLNSEYGDPDGNHIAVQSCASTPSALAPNSADHLNYVCPNSKSPTLALQSLPSGLSLSDGKTHTITVNYLPPGSCTSGCNNFSVYMDSQRILQITLDLAQQLALDGNGAAYIGFTSSTGAAVENADITSWSFSQLPLAPITIVQPLQGTSTTFNFTPTLTASVDYSQSNVSTSGVFMQSTVQSISDADYATLVSNTPFQGSTCLHQDLGSGVYACVTTTDLCTTAANSTPAGSNCPNTGTAALIGASNIFTADPSQKPIVAPAYIMGSDTATSCAATDVACKNLINIFESFVGDPTITGKTKNFNSVLIPAEWVVQPSTTTDTVPMLNRTWANQPVVVNFHSSEIIPPKNTNPPSTLPSIIGINYSVTGANVPSTAAGTLPGPAGSITIPAAVEGTTIVTYSATDSSSTPETIVTTDSSGLATTSLPSLTISIDKTAPLLNCTAPAAVWQITDVSVSCAASDAGSGLANPSQASFSVATAVASGTETNAATIPAVTVLDAAGNSAAQGPFGPFLVDKKTPVITGLAISPAAPVFGQSVTASYICSDGGSGVVRCGPAGSPTIPAIATTGTLSSAADGSVGAHTFTVTATDLAGNSTQSSVNYTVSNQPPPLTLTINPTSIAFGNVKILSLAARVITVKNPSKSPVLFSKISLAQTESDGGPGREFVMINGCGSKLNAGASCSIGIVFVADEIVSAAGTVTFMDNAQGSPQQVQITGNVVKR